MLLRRFRGFTGDRKVRATTDDGGDFLQRHTLIGNRVIAASGRPFLKDQPTYAEMPLSRPILMSRGTKA
jgi:hypothetical protein